MFHRADADDLRLSPYYSLGGVLESATLVVQTSEGDEFTFRLSRDLYVKLVAIGTREGVQDVASRQT